MGAPSSLTTAEIYIQAHEHTAISTVLRSPKVSEQFVDDVYFILKFSPPSHQQYSLKY